MSKIKESNKLKWEGEVLTNKQGQKFTILEYRSTSEVLIKFHDTSYQRFATLSNIKAGSVSDNMAISVYGVGYLGDGLYCTKKDNIQIIAYKIWKAVLQRCYDQKTASYVNYGANGVIVSESWKNYQNFAKWYEENSIESWVLDKDILIKGNKIYSEETCCFVPDEINVLFTKRESKRGDCPIGVSFKKTVVKGKEYISIIAQINKNSTKIHLGCFKTTEEAFFAYKTAKEIHIKELADKYKDSLNDNVYNALMNYTVEITD